MHTLCVDICPTDAFHVGPNFIAINPQECVDCSLCVPECPEEAIVADNALDAGNRIVAAARSASRVPAALTSMICVVLLAWAAHALSGAGVIAPLLRAVLVAIASVFLLRALLGPFVLVGNGRSARFVWVGSAICLVYGLLFLVRLVQRWDALPA